MCHSQCQCDPQAPDGLCFLSMLVHVLNEVRLCYASDTKTTFILCKAIKYTFQNLLLNSSVITGKNNFKIIFPSELYANSTVTVYSLSPNDKRHRNIKDGIYMSFQQCNNSMWFLELFCCKMPANQINIVGITKQHFCQVWFQFLRWFIRQILRSEKVTETQMTKSDAQWWQDLLLTWSPGELKMKLLCFVFRFYINWYLI